MKWENCTLRFYNDTRQWAQDHDVETLIRESVALLQSLSGSDMVFWIQFEDIYTATVRHAIPEHDASLVLEPQPYKDLMTREKGGIVYIPDIDRNHPVITELSIAPASVLCIPADGEKALILLCWNEHQDFTEPGFSDFITSVAARVEELLWQRLLKVTYDDVMVRLSAILQTIAQGVVFIDNGGRTGWVNRQAAGLLNLPVAGEQQPHILSAAMAQLRNKAVNSEEINRRAARLFFSADTAVKDWKWEFDGENPMILDVSCVPVLSEYLEGWLWVFEDVTELHLTNEKLQQETVRADNENRSKTEFLSNMSHEIRTPMNGIIGMTNLLAETELDNTQQDYLHTIRESAENLLVIINDILDFNKIYSGKLAFENIHFSVTEVVMNVVKLLQFKANEKGLVLTQLIDPVLHTTAVEGDPYRLSQILINLLGNAIKYTDEGKVMITTTIESKTPESVMLSFEIKDTGIGIPSEQLEFVFERFSQATTSGSRQYGGTGLGLTISRELTELQGGSIRVQSTVGKGSVFTVVIPYKLSRKTELPKIHAPISDAAFVHFPGAHILVADDNRINQIVAEATLKKWSIRVTVVNNGKEAVEAIGQNHYDLVLMDLKMPEMDGFEAVMKIRNLPEPSRNQVPVIAMTASAMSAERENCMNTGFNEYISKPFIPGDLYRVISTFLVKEPPGN